LKRIAGGRPAKCATKEEKMRRLGLLVSMGLAIFGVPASAQAQDSIKVGVLTELSGPLGTLGMAERDGFLLYLKKAGGKLGGLTVETVVEDTGNDPATALVKARKLLDSDKIDVLLGPMSSASAAAIKTFVSGRGIPCLVQATVRSPTTSPCFAPRFPRAQTPIFRAISPERQASRRRQRSPRTSMPARMR
jgi:ABC-type branched-subunit amino acid transport system substrate-binding protein